jgi:hypothetical protein
MSGDLDAYLRGALTQAGVEVTDEDLAVLRMVHDAMAPQIEVLLAAGVLAEPIEYDLDPSRPPRS